MKRIVSWSGGPDSTATLIHLLQNTDDRVIAIHIKGDMPTVAMDPDITEGEENAVLTLAPILRERYRDFELKVFSHRRFILDEWEDHRGIEAHFFPLIYMLDNEPAVMYIGRNETDKKENWPRYVNGSIEGSYTIRDQLMGAIGVEVVDFNIDKPKSEICLDLGDLWDLTWSCLGPLREKGVQCGVCRWCRQREEAQTKAKGKYK